MNIQRTKPQILAVIIAMLLATSTIHAETNTEQESKPKTDLVATVKFAIVRLQLGEDYAYGSETDTKDLEERLQEGGPAAVARALEPEGDVTLLHRGEARGIIRLGEAPPHSGIRVFIGAEEPFLVESTSYNDGEKVKRVTQQTITSGATAEVVPSIDSSGKLLVVYDFDYDEAYPVERAGNTLIGRTRLDWRGTTFLDRKAPVLIGRFTREYDGKPAEYLLLLSIEENKDLSTME